MVKRRSILAAILAAPALLAIAYAGTAWAQSLNDLRRSGALGERFDGYVEARDPSAQGVAGQVNAKRRAQYEKVATKEGISVDQVGRVYAPKIIAKLPAGAWYLPQGGGWTQK